MTKDEVRPQLWKIAWEGWTDSPKTFVLGQGPDTFEHAYRLRRGESLVEFHGPMTILSHAHGPVQSLLTTGLLGAACAFYLLTRAEIRGPRRAAAAAGLVAAGINLLVNPASVEGLCVLGFLLGVLAPGKLEEERAQPVVLAIGMAGLLGAITYYRAEVAHPFDANELVPCEQQYAADTAEELPKWLNQYRGVEERERLVNYGRDVGSRLSRCRPGHASSQATAAAFSYYKFQLTRDMCERMDALQFISRAVELDPRQEPFVKLRGALTPK